LSLKTHETSLSRQSIALLLTTKNKETKRCRHQKDTRQWDKSCPI